MAREIPGPAVPAGGRTYVPHSNDHPDPEPPRDRYPHHPLHVRSWAAMSQVAAGHSSAVDPDRLGRLARK